VTGYGPPDDPSEAPTGFIDYGDDGYGGPQQPRPGSPWYRKPIVLLVLGLFVAILIGLAIYVLADRTHGSGGSTQTPTSPTTSTGVTTTTPAPTTTEVPAAPAPTTTLTFPPTTTEPTTTPATTTSSPPPPSTTIEDGRHHHHHHADGGTP
jgi:hypothetical protein